MDRVGGKGLGGEEKNEETGEEMESKGRRYILPLLQKFLRAPMTSFDVSGTVSQCGSYHGQ